MRARYYSPQIGNFITEDTYAGDTSNPQTLNRYTYTSNNPVNRIDPSGHSWGKIASGLKKIADKAVEVTKKAAEVVVDTAKKVVNKVKEVAKDVVHAVTHPKETIQKAQQVVKETKQKADNFVQEAKKDPVKVFTTVAAKATKHVSEIKSAVKRAACTSAEYIQEGLGKVDWASVGRTVGKAAAGVAIVAGLGVASVMTGGAAAVILGAAFTGAASGAAIGAVAGGVAGMMSGEGFFAGAADGLLTGSITGAITGLAGQVISTAANSVKLLGNKWVQNGLESAVETVVDTVDTAVHGGDVNAGTIAASFAFNFVTNGGDVPKTQKVRTNQISSQNSITQPDFIVGPSGTVVSNEVYNMSNEEFIQEVANISNKSINEQLVDKGKATTGHVAGSLKHGEAERIIKTYQDDIGTRGLAVEQNYLEHSSINNNAKGSVRLDVYDKIANQVYDYKFVTNPGKGLSSRQIDKIIKHGPSGLRVSDIHEINPK